MEQDESRRRLPLQQGTPSQSTGECPEEVKGEAGKSWSEETTGEVIPLLAWSSEGPRVLGTGGTFSHSQEDYGHLVDSDP